MPGKDFRAAVIGLGRMGSTFDDEITSGGQFFMPYCHAPTYVASPPVQQVSQAAEVSCPHLRGLTPHQSGRRR